MSLQTPYTCTINAAKFKLQSLNGKEYLTGPVVMAKVGVMNKVMYTEAELSRSVPGWNFRPVTVNHPSDSDGGFITANEPATLEKFQVGFIFNTRMDKGKLKSEVWLDKELLANHTDLKDKIDAGEMIEVSTGLFLDAVEKEGIFANKEYTAVGEKYIPDHLALLVDQVGACSIKDGAGFPRANMELEANEMLPNDKYDLISAGFRSWIKKMYETEGFDKTYPYDSWIDAIHDNFVITKNWGDGGFWKLNYTVDEGTGNVAFSNPVAVIRTVEYKEKVKMADNEEKQVETPVTPVANAEEAKVETPVEPATNAEVPKVEETKVEEPAPVVNEDEAAMKELFANAKAEAVEAICMAKNNAFSKEELEGMSFNMLKKISALAKAEEAPAPAVNHQGLGGPGGLTPSASTKVKVKPL